MHYDPQTPGLDPDCTFTLIAWRAFHGTTGRPVVLVAAPQSVRLHAHGLTQDVTFAFPPLSRDVPGKYRFFCLADCADEVPELGDASKGLNNLRRYPMDGYLTWPPS